MAVQKTALLVFLFPVVISIAFGASVLSDVLGQPDRHLNMWQFVNTKQSVQTGDKDIRIQNLSNSYSASMPVSITVAVNNTAFDCGDLYITIYDLGAQNQVASQNGYFSQCFVENNSSLPIHDTFSQIIGKPGNYEIVAEIKDKNYQNTINATAHFRIQ